jgi:hypothetical protein
MMGFEGNVQNGEIKMRDIKELNQALDIADTVHVVTEETLGDHIKGIGAIIARAKLEAIGWYAVVMGDEKDAEVDNSYVVFILG